MSSDVRIDLRCFCARHPLLATYGFDDRGRLNVHVRVHKQKKIYGDILAYGETKIRCRECLRWHTVRFSTETHKASLEESREPEEIAGF